jgi:UDP-N-acetylglucosamine 2-epimerase
MNRLLLVEVDTDQDRLLRFLKKHKLDDSPQRTLLFSERAEGSNQYDDFNLEVQSVDDVLSLHGEKGNELFLTARDLAREIKEYLSSTTSYPSSLQYDNLSLWELVTYEIEKDIRHSLRKLQAIQEVLASGKWASIHSFESYGSFWEIFRFVANIKSISGCTKRHKIPNSIALFRQIGRKLVPTWSTQLLRDIYYGFRSRPLPELRASRPESLPYMFVVGSYNTYLSTLLPVVQEVSRDYEVIILNKGGVIRSQVLEKQGIPLSYCSQHVRPTAWPRVFRHTQKLKRAWHHLRTDRRISEKIHYEGQDIWPVLAGLIRNILVRLLPRIIVWIEAMKTLYESVRPRAVVVLPDRHGLARATLSLASVYNIPTLTIQSALMSDTARYGPMYADQVAAIDHYSRQIYVERGNIDSKRVALTGLPRWDIMSTAMRRTKLKDPSSKVRAELQIDGDKRIVTFAAQNLPLTHTLQMLTPVLSTTAAMPDTVLLIKLHPADKHSVEDYYAEVSAMDLGNHNLIVIDDIDTPTLLAASDLLITGFSNVALEAALLDKPVLIVNLTNQPDPLPFVENGIALGAYSEVEVEQKLKTLLTDESTREALRARRAGYFDQNPQLLDGRATERVVALLKEMASYPTEK